ncbi:mannitol dehydrogenase family protein [Candidatus Mycobacterium wuenschmannii]|uniref:Mannitol dehydrogenase family protein n=1 Tax=Candidatus Mycobacterium wuenschmannii TaxID=3027808 RepID=A0ABY8VRC6_9MYCO|nr:mannitol dehydrogenase family protein [Candidatus Mycobacterium wuenschmannii]WIM85876.1 mannitol dehydrogenase family protein [Candidatus Mycobacterium wuenschmannii]
MPNAIPLNNSALADLPIDAPKYDRGSVSVGIAHIGTGHFHRAHQAAYINLLLQQGLAHEWGICGIGVMPGDWTMREVMDGQDGLYTLILEHPGGTRSAQVIGSIIDYRFAPDDPESALEVLAAPTTKIISLTITEGGYLDPDGPAFTLITQALDRRRSRGIPAPTIVSCDNIENNGEVAKRTVLASAERVDPELAEWVGEHARFPNSMVDRITPATTLEMAAEVRRDFGVDDRWPVVAEPFSAWVIEDDFADGRPPLEKAGVLVVDDVRPYELMKLRMLNAGHQCLCYFAHLCGFEFVHDAAQDPVFAKFLLSYLEDEAIPTLPPVPGIDLHEFARTLVERFANPAVRDTVSRICAYSSDRIPKFLFPVICDNLANDGPVAMASAAVASWARYAEGVDEWGEPYEVLDRLADALIPIARSQHENPNAFIEITAVFNDLAHQHRFVEAYRWALDSLHSKGARATLEALVQ